MIEWVRERYRNVALVLGAEPPKVDEATLIERATRGTAARHFLESRLVSEFVADAEAKLIQEMVNCPLGDDDGRKRLAVAIQTQRQLWRWLGRLASDGASAEKELERLRSGKRSFF